MAGSAQEHEADKDLNARHSRLNAGGFRWNGYRIPWYIIVFIGSVVVAWTRLAYLVNDNMERINELETILRVHSSSESPPHPEAREKFANHEQRLLHLEGYLHIKRLQSSYEQFNPESEP